MTALLDATDSQMAALAGLVESVRLAEQTLAGMQAARDGLLALAGRLALDIAKQGDHPDRGDHSIRCVAAELGTVQRVNDRTIEHRMAAASLLVEHFPSVWAAQGSGRLSSAHSRVIVEAGSHLADSHRAAYAAIMIPLAERESPSRLRLLARRVAERFAERPVGERHREARKTRRAWVSDGEDGMAQLHACGPAVLIHGMFDRLSQMAHALRDENRRVARKKAHDGGECEIDDRTVDEIRADLLADLVLGGEPTAHDTADGPLGAIRGRVEVTVPVTTLMGDDIRDAFGRRIVCENGSPSAGSTPISFLSAPAELDGRVPIDVGTARALAGRVTGWDRVLTHPISGRMLAVDRYRPSKHLRRHLRARDQRCRFPACGIAARMCDLDHTQAAAVGGETRETNLADLCRRHHVLKHHSPWHIEQREGGVLEWTSPTGRVYLDHPPTQNTVVFRQDVRPSNMPNNTDDTVRTRTTETPWFNALVPSTSAPF